MRALLLSILALPLLAAADPVPVADRLQAFCGPKGVRSPRLVLVTGPGRAELAAAAAARLQAPLRSVETSRYIGETEKNIDAMFARPGAADAVLFFDEADALFGKRTAGRDGRDRYANQEVSYLRHRMERHAGLVIVGLARAPSEVPAAGIVLGDPQDMVKLCE